MGEQPVGEQVVVGAALIVEGRLLAARRTAPPAAAGRWELPGGKVEPGESPEAALIREIDEELGCLVEVVRWLETKSTIRAGLVLQVGLVDLVGGTPRAREHDRVAWLAVGEVDSLDWLDADRPFLAELESLLGSQAGHQAGYQAGSPPVLSPSVPDGSGTRGIFFDEADARAVAAVLERGGWRVEVGREKLAGEDDDDDHPWAVLTDAPEPLLDALVESHDGWLDVAEPVASEVPPLPPLRLPTAPRRPGR